MEDVVALRIAVDRALVLGGAALLAAEREVLVVGVVRLVLVYVVQIGRVRVQRAAPNGLRDTDKENRFNGSRLSPGTCAFVLT